MVEKKVRRKPIPRVAQRQYDESASLAQAADTATMDRAALAAHLGLSMQTVWRYERDLPGFPQPVYFSTKPRWFVKEVNAWIEQRASQRPSARRAAAEQAETEGA